METKCSLRGWLPRLPLRATSSPHPVVWVCSNANPWQTCKTFLKLCTAAMQPPSTFATLAAINHGGWRWLPFETPKNQRLVGRCAPYSRILLALFCWGQYFLNLPSLPLSAIPPWRLCICVSASLSLWGFPFRVCFEKRRKNINPNAKTNFADPPLAAGQEAWGRRINFRPSFSLYCRDLCLARHWARGVLAKNFFGLREKLFTPGK